MSESKTTICITMDSEFAEKFLGLLKNLISVNDDSLLTIDSVTVDEIVAYPKEK